MDRNIALKLCLNEFWTIISKHLFYDKPVQFINNLTSLSNRKQKVILWILIKIYEHKVEDLLNLLLEEEDLKVLFKPNCKLLVFKEEILKAFLMLSSFEFSLNFKITQKYEEFLQEPKTSCFSFHFSKYIKDSGIDFSKESLREDDPITLWQQKSKTLNFNEFQMKILKKETEEITDLIHDSDFLSNFLLKYYNNTTSSKNSFESQLNKHKLFLTTLTENMHKKDPLNQKELLDKKNSFLMDFALVKKDFLQRLENINYLKSHTYPNNYQKEEDDINSILTHLEYLFSFLDQIFNESENFSNEIQLDYNNHHNKEDEGEGIEDEKNLIMELDYNRISNSNMVYTYSPGTSLSQGFLKKSNTIGNNDSRIMRKKRSHLFLTSYQYNDKKFKEKPLLPTTVYIKFRLFLIFTLNL